MKNLIIFLSILLFLPACTNNQEEIINNELIDTTPEQKLNISINTTEDINPIKIGLYENKSLVKTYQTTLANHKEITVFNVYYTNVETLDSQNIKYNWNKYYNQYENIDKYKIGFYITFEAEGKTIEQLILDPTSKHIMEPYLYIYLYDDVHQPDGTWYSHLEPVDMKDNTVFSSIKLYLAQQGSKISSPISLTVFTYDEDDIDESGKYKGTSKYTVTINTK